MSLTFCTTTTGPNASSRMSRACGGASATIAGPRMAPRRSGLSAEFAAFGNRVLDHLFDPVGRRAADHRPDVGRSVIGVADLKLFGSRDEQFEKPLEHRPLDDDALRRDALLAARLESGAGDARRGIVEIGSAQTMFAAFEPSWRLSE